MKVNQKNLKRAIFHQKLVLKTTLAKIAISDNEYFCSHILLHYFLILAEKYVHFHWFTS